MGKLCIKCGYERSGTEQAPEGECPKCGVIYARAEAAAAQARQLQQIKLTTALSRRATEDSQGANGFFRFTWMITPALVRIIFFVTLIALLITAVYSMVSGEGVAAVLALAAIFVVRLSLEGVMVVFRLAEDVADIRELLNDQVIEALRQAP